MNVERYSVGNFSNLKALFDDLCQWDGRTEAENAVTYSYGGGTVKISLTSSNYIKVELTAGGSSQNIYPQGTQRLNFLIVKTASSIGIMAEAGSAGNSPSNELFSSGALRFILTKCINNETGEEERGIVKQVAGSSNGYYYLNVSSASKTVTTNMNVALKTDNAATSLFAASCDVYPGYCPHVFIPVLQSCGASSSKCTLNGKSYYILGGTMYVLDD